MDVERNQSSLPPETDPQTIDGRSLSIDFTGSTGEYFRIWIVNVLLTLATFGIYWAWAKVRTRRYFYEHTWLDGQAFDYLANPIMLLKGHLLLFFALVLFKFTEGFSQQVSGYIAGVAMCLLPYLIYKAHRFKAINSAYRNIRFKFMGSALEAYGAYALLPLGGIFLLLGNLVSLYLGLPAEAQAATQSNPGPGGLAGLLPLLIFGVIGLVIYPYFIYLQQGYFHGNLAYGGVYSRFGGQVRPYHQIYLYATFIGAISMILLVMLASIITPLMTELFSTIGPETGDTFNPEQLASFLSFGIAMMISIVIINQYLYVKKLNYSWGQTRLGEISFNFSLQAPDLIWIRLTNLFAIILSLGLLIPWARIRRARYIFSRIEVSLPSDMDDIQAASAAEEGALGDTAADFFDWEIGW
jgi:uncharacterized membrane protein YjgN (DUF898 family)